MTSHEYTTQYQCSYCRETLHSLEEMERHLESCRKEHQYFCYELRYVYCLDYYDSNMTVKICKIYSESREEIEKKLCSKRVLLKDGVFTVFVYVSDDSNETILSMAEAAKSEMASALRKKIERVESLIPSQTFLKN